MRTKHILLLCCFFLAACSKQFGKDPSLNDGEDSLVIGIAWTPYAKAENYNNVHKALDDLGIRNVFLDEVFHGSFDYNGLILDEKYADENGILKMEYAQIVKSSSYIGSNVDQVTKGISAVIFPGGSDISPTLYAVPVPWHNISAEKDYNATRDVSDYLLMSYCLDNDIPVLGICRGMQVLGVVSGVTMIQDIPTWFEQNHLEYNNEHRQAYSQEQDYAVHDVHIAQGSKTGKLFGAETVEKCPSWHHQCIDSVDGTNLNITGVTPVSGINMVECVERNDKRLAVGVQFHPEAAYMMHLNETSTAWKFMTKEQAGHLFKMFAEESKLYQ